MPWRWGWLAGGTMQGIKNEEQFTCRSFYGTLDAAADAVIAG